MLSTADVLALQGYSSCLNTIGSFACVCDKGFTDIKAQDTWIVQGNDAFAVEWRSGADVYLKIANPDPESDQIVMESFVGGIVGPVETMYWARPGRQVTILVSITPRGFLLHTNGKQVSWEYPQSLSVDTELTARTVTGLATVLTESGSTASACDEVDECADGTHNCDVSPRSSHSCISAS